MQAFTMFSIREESIEGLYSTINTYPTLGRIGCVPLAILEHSLDITGTFLEIIENIGLMMINLVGMWRSDNYSLKDSVFCLQEGLERACKIPILILIAPFRILFQTVAIAIAPEHVVRFENG